MNYRRFLISVTAAILLLIVACTAGKKTPDTLDLQSEVRRDTAPDVSATMLGELVGDNNRFAFDLFQTFQGKGNLFFSPYSISTALAMTYAGARGETAEQIADVLHYNLPQAQLHPAFNALNLSLMETDHQEGFVLVFANALWGQEGIVFLQEYLDLMAAQYGAGMHLVNFRNQAGRRYASERINQWASNATDERISDLVNPDIFTELTQLVLTNAITFDGLWEDPFDDTSNSKFTLLDGTTVKVPLMQRRVNTAYASGENWQAAELSYRGNRANMLILLPSEGQFEAFARELDTAHLAEIEAAMKPTELALFLPRFKYAGNLNLPEPLNKMGMPLAFSENQADFSGLVAIPPRLYISDILHKAYVEVNETGTKAAAATVVELEAGAESSIPEVMRVDRPFIFLIRDTHHGTILFLGCMMNPTDLG